MRNKGEKSNAEKDFDATVVEIDRMAEKAKANGDVSLVDSIIVQINSRPVERLMLSTARREPYPSASSSKDFQIRIEAYVSPRECYPFCYVQENLFVTSESKKYSTGWVSRDNRRYVQEN